jgi:hypothetical protein
VLGCAAVRQIIGKGVPEDAMQGIPDKQVPLPDELVNFQYMYNSTGSKVSSVCCDLPEQPLQHKQAWEGCSMGCLQQQAACRRRLLWGSRRLRLVPASCRCAEVSCVFAAGTAGFQA